MTKFFSNLPDGQTKLSAGSELSISNNNATSLSPTISVDVVTSAVTPLILGSSTIRVETPNLVHINNSLVNSYAITGLKNSVLALTASQNNRGSIADNVWSPMLTFNKPGVSGQAYDSQATFFLRRYDNTGTNPNSELTLSLQHVPQHATNDTSTQVMRWRSNGTAAIFGADNSTSAITGCLALVGGLGVGKDIYATGNISCTALTQRSDKRLKSDIQPLQNSLDKVNKLAGVSYTFDPTGDKYIGLIAQEVEPIVPQVVTTSPDGFKSIQYGNVVALLIEAVKELSTQVHELQKKQ